MPVQKESSIRKNQWVEEIDGGEMGLASYIWSAVPFVAMVTVECTDIGVSVISKAAMSKGMSNIVSVVYYNALASFILLPYFLFCRNKQAPLTFSLLCKFFLLGLMG